MWKHLKKSLILLIIKRNTDKTRVKGPKASLHTAGRVGLLAKVDSKERLDKIVNLKKSIESYGPKVSCIAYVPFRAAPGYFDTQMQVTVFTKKDVNLFGIPGGRSAKDFMKEEYDILVDLSYDEYLPLIYLAGMTRAGLKAGKYRDDMVNVYDLMVRENENRNFGDFIFSMKNYLSKINTTVA